MNKKEAIALLNNEGWTKADAKRALELLDFKLNLELDELTIRQAASKFAGVQLYERQRLQAAQKGMVTKKNQEIQQYITQIEELAYKITQIYSWLVNKIMSYKQTKVRTFQGMGYRQVQRKNTRNKKLLVKEQQQWLKKNDYRNVGWQNVIDLFNKIQEIQQTENIKKLTLEELFIEADLIGNKYLDSKEINQHNLKIARELNEIADIIDSWSVDNTVEIIDYSQTLKGNKRL